MFRAKSENASPEFLSKEQTIDIGILDCERQDETVDEFYDLPEPSDDLLENGLLTNSSPESCYVVILIFGFKLLIWSQIVMLFNLFR